MIHTYVPTRFDVTGQVPSLSESLSISAWIFAPEKSSAEISPAALVCLPGGSYTKAYYHLEVPGLPEDAYSFALHMVKRGLIVVAIDHLGVGESTWPADGMALTLEVLAQANDAVTRQVRNRLAEGILVEGVAPQHDPFLVGVGHSVGGFLLVTQQANHSSFAAIAPLGYSNKVTSTAGAEKRWSEQFGIPLEDHETLRELQAKLYQIKERGYGLVDRSLMYALFHADDVPGEVIEADNAVATQFPLGIMADINNPEFLLAKAAVVDVPIFLGNGELDVAANFHSEVATYPLAHDIRLYQLAGSAHCHNFATTRRLLWDRLAHWIREIHPRL